MGILDLILIKKKLTKSPEKVWDEYTSNYFKKYDLSTDLTDLIEGPKTQDLPTKIINKLGELEKLIPKELIELSEEEIKLEIVMQELESIKSLIPQLGDIDYIMKNYEFLTDDANKLVVHMKNALEVLARVLKAQLSLIILIKKDPVNRDNILKLFQLIVNNEFYLAEIFGKELDEKEYKKIKKIVNAALKSGILKMRYKSEIKERKIIFDYPEESRKIKNRLDKIQISFNQILSKLGESDDFEIFYTQTRGGSMPPYTKPQYGIFIRLKKDKTRDFPIIFFSTEDLNERIKNDELLKEIFSEYNLGEFERTLKKGIRILKHFSK